MTIRTVRRGTVAPTRRVLGTDYSEARLQTSVGKKGLIIFTKDIGGTLSITLTSDLNAYACGSTEGPDISFLSHTQCFGQMRNAETAIFHCVRLYNRNLTAAEVKANWEMDKARFRMAENPISEG